VPLALAIIQEQVVPLFETVPTVPQLRLVIDKVLSLAADRGIGSAPLAAKEPEETLEPEEVEALAALEIGDFSSAKVAYQSWLNRAPGNTLAQLGLAQVELLLRIDGLVLEDVIAQADQNLTNVPAQLQAADCEMAQGKYEVAFARLIAAIKISNGETRKEIREHLVGLFSLVDPTEPLLIRARQQLASALF
jgi:putative thioredoxin